MKKFLCVLLILSVLCLSPLALCGCAKKVKFEIWDPAKYTETLDLTKYTQVFFDDFEGELNRDIWGDTRQGTRRDGYWTKNLAFTDGIGNLIIRTEKRGSHYCSDTQERQVTGYNGSVVKVKYDDCNPFGLIAGDFGDLANIQTHTTDLVGNVITANFHSLSASFASFLSHFEIPAEGTEYAPSVGTVALGAYNPFYETAMELFNYYSFVKATKVVSTPLNRSAVIGANYFCAMTFGSELDARSVDYRAVIARLFGFSSEEDFTACAQSLADRLALINGGTANAALINGAFHTDNGSFVFPIAFENADAILLCYVIADAEGRVSVWINDTGALLKATNYSAAYFAGATVSNETYCKNTLFVTGPEGVYSGALRTRDLYTHGFGYYEIRCKLPAVEGIWHAFWMMCGDVYSEEGGSEDGVEIDVFEYLPARDAINVALHWDGYDEAHKNAHKRFEKTGLADGEYHTFGMNWDETGYTFYIDGKKVWKTSGGGVCRQPGYMKISTEYGDWGDWVGTLKTERLPVDWVIDYVKIYDKN